jgi:cytochrome c oxidase assembly protein subunit 17
MSTAEATPQPPKKTPGCKICCACPKQRRARDECTIFKSLEECQTEIAGFYKCLLEEGFSQADVDSLKRNVRM